MTPRIPPDGGGNFYLQVNGRDFLVRGATYTPDLLYRYDPDRDAAILRYAKDLGLNMLRLESKISSDEFAAMADELGIPLMYGWMCCNQWEKWPQWDAEDRRVARRACARRSTCCARTPRRSSGPTAATAARLMRSGPPTTRSSPTCTGRTPSSTPSRRSPATPGGKPLWDGIQMAGPYSWRPPSYWFSGRYGAARGSSAEQGDNEHIPPFASLREFIPPDKLWPINDTWYFHAGSAPQNSTLSNVRRVIDRRYGPSNSAQMFADKAQLAHYEATRAQFESFAANGWDGHKMTIYWMLNSHWPSFFGNIFDYYLRPGGAYYGAKKGLRPLSVVFDSYATGQPPAGQGQRGQPEPGREIRSAGAGSHLRHLPAGCATFDTPTGSRWHPAVPSRSMTVPAGPADSPVFFVRAELLDADGAVVAENVYWQSQSVDDVGPPANDAAFDTKQISWADMTALNRLPKVALDVDAHADGEGDGRDVTMRLHNSSTLVAFFERAELLAGVRPARDRRRDPAHRVRRQLRHGVPRRDGRDPRPGARRRPGPGLGAGNRIQRHAGRRAGALSAHSPTFGADRIGKGRPCSSTPLWWPLLWQARCSPPSGSWCASAPPWTSPTTRASARSCCPHWCAGRCGGSAPGPRSSATDSRRWRWPTARSFWSRPCWFLRCCSRCR